MNTAIRKMDDLNRIVLPTKVKAFGWSQETALDIVIQKDESVVIRAHKSFCKLCGSSDEVLIKVENGCICNNCLQSALQNQRAECLQYSALYSKSTVEAIVE